MDEHEAARVVPNPKWVRAMLGGRTVVDSRDVQLVWEHQFYPAWFFPVADVDGELVANGETLDRKGLGTGTRYDLVVDGKTIANAVTRYLESPNDIIANSVRLEWDALDTWLEEDVEAFVHPRSPEVRIDALRSSREVRVSLNGVELAHTRQGTFLFETGLPTRYYIPKTDVRMELLQEVDTETACPYKGWARYWDVVIDGEVHADLAWGYRTALPESTPIVGLVSFYNEHVDIEVDGQPVERPSSVFTDDKFA